VRLAWTALGLVISLQVHAQDLEPRAYSAVPVGTNFLVVGYNRVTGSTGFDAASPIQNVQATIDSAVLGYERTFGLFGRQASAAVLLPYVHGDISGEVFEQNRAVTRSGLGDLAMRLAVNLFGGPALRPREFAQRKPSTALGASLLVIAPTGDYNSDKLINISSNRWSFRPELGVTHSIGNWFLEAAGGVFVFTDNDNFFGGRRRHEQPIGEFQGHVGYNFRPGLWLAGDFVYYAGGETSINGASNHDSQANSRIGASLSLPIVEGLTVKFAYSTWFTTRNGGQFETFTARLAYRWFD
jgi:hypothetical protein